MVALSQKNAWKGSENYGKERETWRRCAEDSNERGKFGGDGEIVVVESIGDGSSTAERSGYKSKDQGDCRETKGEGKGNRRCDKIVNAEQGGVVRTPFTWQININGKLQGTRKDLCGTCIWKPPWRQWKCIIATRQFLGMSRHSDTFIWWPPWSLLWRIVD